MQDPYEDIYIKNRIPGHFYLGDFYSLVEISNLLPESGTILNIGTYFGRSAKFWADILRHQNKQYQIICLDIFTNRAEDVFDAYMGTGSAGDLLLIKDFLHKTKNNLEMAQDILKEYKEIKFSTYDILTDSPKKINIDNLKCVFDDSLHTTKGVDKCFQDWFPLLGSDGIYCGHDYSPGWHPEVFRQVNIISKNMKLKIHIPRKDSSMYYFKTHRQII